MDKELKIAIMNIQAAGIHRMIADMVKMGVIQKADTCSFELLYEAISRAYKEVAALESKTI